MNPSDSLQLDEHLARLLAAYDQGIGDGDPKAATVDLDAAAELANGQLRPAHKSVPLVVGHANQGSLGELIPDGHSPPQTPPPAGPHRVGRFELRRQLGKGGCGIVFLAYDPRLHREVALKIPRPEMLLSPDARKRLVREAQAAAEFDHPNLVPVYETGEIGPVCFIATAYCPGQTLSEWIEKQSFPVPVRQAARLVATLAEAVQHAHDRGVLHRDLKPNNVILQVVNADPNANEGPPLGSVALRGEHFVPRVVDFGLAKLAERGPSDTATRQVLGTPKYMAPEQAQGRRDDVGPQADVYALGVVLYELLAGRTPFDGATDVEVLRQAIDGRLVAPRDLRKDIPRDLEAICLKAMDRAPGQRYRTAIDFAEDLRRFLEGLPTRARPLNFFGRTGRWVRRNDQWFALGVISSVALVFLGVGVWQSIQNQQFRTDQNLAKMRQAEQLREERRAQYARHVRAAFLSWRSGDPLQMADSLNAARQMADLTYDDTEFAHGYLSQLGRIERQSIPCPAGAAVALSVSPDGTRLATGHLDGTLAIWDANTSSLLGSVKAHQHELTQAVFLADGRRIVTIGGDASAKCWAVGASGTPTLETTLPAPGGATTSLVVSPERRFVCIGTATGRCQRWDSTEQEAVRTWAATGGGPVESLAVSPDGQTLATAGRGESIRLWTAATAKLAGEIRAANGATAMTVIPDANRGWLLAAAERNDGTVRLYDPQGREIRMLPGPIGSIHTLAASPDGAVLASGGQDDSVCVWDVNTGAVRSLLRGHDKAVRGVRFGPDGNVLYSVAEDGMLKVWDLSADPEGQSLRGLNSPVDAMAIHPLGREYAVAFADGSVEVYPNRGASPRRFSGDGRGPLALLSYRQNGPPLGVELNGRIVECWSFGDVRQSVFRAELPEGAVATAADFATESGRLIVGDSLGRITAWDIGSGVALGTWDTELQLPVRRQLLVISDDGTRIAAPTTDHSIGVWIIGGSPTPTYRVRSHTGGLWLTRFLPGGARLVIAGRGGSIRIMSLSPPREELLLLGHVGQVTTVAISPDGRTLVSGSSTGEIKLWDMRTGLELVGLRRHTGTVNTAEFAPNGLFLMTGGTTAGGRGELAFWDAKRG